MQGQHNIKKHIKMSSFMRSKYYVHNVLRMVQVVVVIY